MIRNFLKGDKMTSKSGFRYRGVSFSRLEGITDAVFGFSITLLVVSLEVPHTFLELESSMFGFLGFIFAAIILFIFWNDHYDFFLRYGLEDTKTKVLNFIFIFLMLLYVYPLKFLFNILGTGIFLNIREFFGDKSEAFLLKKEEFNSTMNLSESELGSLLVSYALGLILIYLVFFFFYKNALKYKEELELNAIELYETKVKLYSYPVMMIVPLTSLLIVLLAPESLGGYAGTIYCLFGVVIPLYEYLAKKRMTKLGLLN